jgi:hypothetical protein
VALELPDKAITVVIAAVVMALPVVAVQAKLDLTGRNLSQLAAETVLRHQLQAHL